MAISSPEKTCRGGTEKGTCDDPSDLEVTFVEDHSGGLTKLKKARETEVILVAGNLENAVRGGVVDWCSRREVLISEPCDDLRARGMAIAQRTMDSASLPEFPENF